MNYADNSTKISTCFGTLLSIAVNIQTEDIFKTMILAVVGGICSFIATLLMKYFIRRVQKRFGK